MFFKFLKKKNIDFYTCILPKNKYILSLVSIQKCFGLLSLTKIINFSVFLTTVLSRGGVSQVVLIMSWCYKQKLSVS